MNNNDVLRARTDYCVGKTCRNCIFRTYAIKFNTRCCYLTIDQIYEILQLIKEEESMTKKEEIQQEIEKTQKQLAALQEKLKEAEDEVPEEIIFKENDKYWFVDGVGSVYWTDYSGMSPSDAGYVRGHRTFKNRAFAEIFAKKTRFIADMLHFKYLYDRDYMPDWNLSAEWKWTVVFDHSEYNNEMLNEYIAVMSQNRESAATIYFSTQELAERCAEWLNKKYGYTKE